MLGSPRRTTRGNGPVTLGRQGLYHCGDLRQVVVELMITTGQEVDLCVRNGTRVQIGV